MLICSVFWTHQEYLLKLQAIRRQNYQERKRIQQRMVSDKVCGCLLSSQHKSLDRSAWAVPLPQPSAPAAAQVRAGLDPEARRRKIAALKVRGVV